MNKAVVKIPAVMDCHGMNPSAQCYSPTNTEHIGSAGNNSRNGSPLKQKMHNIPLKVDKAVDSSVHSQDNTSEVLEQEIIQVSVIKTSPREKHPDESLPKSSPKTVTNGKRRAPVTPTKNFL